MLLACSSNQSALLHSTPSYHQQDQIVYSTAKWFCWFRPFKNIWKSMSSDNHQCSTCKKTFASKHSLTAHQKIHKERERQFECGDCAKKFLTRAYLEKHQSIVHTNIRNFVCGNCSKTFKSANNLQTHQLVHEEKAFLCRFCEKTFARLQDVRIHERTHTKVKDFECEDCKKTFNQQSNLLSHVNVVCRSAKVVDVNFHESLF